MSRPRAIIFGASGQDGFYLRELLERKGWEVAPFDQRGMAIRVDVADAKAVDSLIRRYRPSRIFHLAAHSSTSHEAGEKNFRTIGMGAWNILSSAWRHVPQARVFIAGSGVQFLNRGRPIREEDPFAPSSPYAVARIAAVYAARYFRRMGLAAYVGYLFHHESPRRKPEQISRRIAAVAAGGSQGPVLIGNLNVRKEWAFAGDIVEGIWSLVSQGRVMEACIGTGKAFSIAEWSEACFSQCGGDWRKKIHPRKGKFIPEYSLLVSSPRKMFALGWRPRTTIWQLASLMVESEWKTQQKHAPSRPASNLKK